MGLVPFRCSLFDIAGVIAHKDNTGIYLDGNLLISPRISNEIRSAWP